MEHKIKNIFQQGPIDPLFVGESIAKHHSKHSIGAHSIFLGQVRNDSINEKEVTAIEYSSYEPMALEKMHEIRQAIFAKYSLTCMHVHHSLGKVKTGEISLFVFTSSKHRRDAIDACTEVVELIKKELPVWGKEMFESGEHVWKENR